MELPDTTPSNDSTPSLQQINEVLQNKRRARSQKVCQPCRLRKVKCSYGTPCESCAERDHPELCSYAGEPPKKRVHLDRTAASTSWPIDVDYWTPSRQDWDALHDRLSDIQNSLQGLHNLYARPRPDVSDLGATQVVPITTDERNSSEDVSMPPVVVQEGFNNGTGYLGGNSVPAMVNALATESHDDTEMQKLLSNSFLPVFGLDNESATYPFVDLWGVPFGSFERIELLCRLLPSTDDCMQTFKLYRDTAYVIFPGIIDISEFESELLNFLQTRATTTLSAESDSKSTQVVFGKDLHWLGLLFGALASGVQCSDLPRKERQMKSQVFVCSAYECLRLVNYYTHTTLVDIQILLVVGNVISNNMNAGISWSLLGLTIRLAQSMGLHYDAPSSDLNVMQTTRSKVWWRIVWQDSLLSITFDRSSPTTIVAHHRHLNPSSSVSYIKCMQRLCRIGLDLVQERSVPRPTKERLPLLIEMRDRIDLGWQSITPHLKDLSKCRSVREMLEHWNLYLHRSFLLSELCRPAIQYRTKVRNGHSALALSGLKALCMENLANTVDAFLGLHNMTKFAMRSWAAVHRALSCSLLLGILGELQRNTRAQTLVTQLAAVMSEVVLTIDPSELSAPLTRSVTALQEMTAHSTVPDAECHPLQSTFGDVPAESGLGGRRSTGVSDTGTSGSSPQLSPMDYNLEPFSVLNNIFWGTGTVELADSR